MQHNSGLLWKTIKDIIKHKNTKQQDITVLKDENDELTDNPQHMSNIFTEYFSNLGRNMASKIPNPSSSQSPTSNLQTYNKSFFLKPISVEEVFNQIMYLNPLKSTQSNSPPLKFIKMAAPIIAVPLADIFSCCISSSTSPNIFKTADIIPIFKSGGKHTCSNYRPISLILPFSKIFEICLYKQLNEFFTINSILCKYQFGFRENHSTELAVSQICDDIINSLEQKSITCSIFLDLAKAFDTVNHSILLSKLNKCGIRGPLLELFQSYSTNRKQCTINNNVKSSWLNSNCGVPQGSTLDLYFFNILYINDLPTVTNLQIQLFAVDAILSHTNTNPSKLQNETYWMKANQLTINHKTNYMIFTKKRINQFTFTIQIGQNKIVRVNKISRSDNGYVIKCYQSFMERTCKLLKFKNCQRILGNL